MFDPPPSHQASITLFYRGPEWAIAVRQGDLVALEWALQRCSSFWNGASTLIIPIRADGRVPSTIFDQLDLRAAETCFIHNSVPADAWAQAARKLGPTRVRQWSPAWDEFADEELHPLHLQPKAGTHMERTSLRIPVFASATQRLISTAAWGHIPENDLSHYREVFEVGHVSDPMHAHAAVLAGQTHGSSPLEQSMSLIHLYGPLPMGRSLFVFNKGSFNEVVRFWNLRSRTREVSNQPMLFGISAEALRCAETLRPLVNLIQHDDLVVQEPDIGIMGSSPGEAAKSLMTLGFEERHDRQISRSMWGRRGNRAFSFGFFEPMTGGAFQRGAVIHDQVTFLEGETSLKPARPQELPKSGDFIRVGIEGLPLAMPITNRSADKIHSHAYASAEGVTLKTNAWFGESFIRFILPDAWDALTAWAESQNESVKLSPPGAYGQALLDRLGNLRALSAIADERALLVLEALTPVSRKKLAQRVVQEANDQFQGNLDEQVLADLLARQSQFLELKARSASEIAGLAGHPKQDLLPALGALVEAGFIARGAKVRCPRCKIGAVLLLEEQSEKVRCRACHNEYFLPVLEQDGQAERPVVYQLDGLMARAMDQDLLPVLLTLRASMPEDPSTIKAAWLGLEFSKEETTKEHDLLLSDGKDVWIAECKATASITEAQLENLLDFCATHQARPILAALSGNFSDLHRGAVHEQEGRVLERPQLLRHSASSSH
jgi:hypothetical protein